VDSLWCGSDEAQNGQLRDDDDDVRMWSVEWWVVAISNNFDVMHDLIVVFFCYTEAYNSSCLSLWECMHSLMRAIINTYLMWRQSIANEGNLRSDMPNWTSVEPRYEMNVAETIACSRQASRIRVWTPARRRSQIQALQWSIVLFGILCMYTALWNAIFRDISLASCHLRYMSISLFVKSFAFISGW